MTIPAGIMLTPSGDIPDAPTWATDVRYVMQACEVAVRMHLGEWIPDRTVGLPHAEDLATKPPPLRRREARTRATLSRVAGVERVVSVACTFDPTTEAATTSALLIVNGEQVRIDVGVSPTIGGNAGAGVGASPGFSP